MNICAKCKHHKLSGSDIWYNWTCLHPDHGRVLGIDPVSGEPGYYAKNSLGMMYLTDDQRPYCRDHNGEGTCKKWEKQ